MYLDCVFLSFFLLVAIFFLHQMLFDPVIFLFAKKILRTSGCKNSVYGAI